MMLPVRWTVRKRLSWDRSNKVDSGCNRKCRTMVADNLSVTLSASYALTVHGSPFSANLSCVSSCARPF